MGEAHLARPGNAPAPDERRLAGGVVGAAERALGDQRLEARTPGRVDGRGLERLFGRERGKDPRQPPGEHRLARARRSREQQVVASGGGNLQRAPGESLTAHVGEVRHHADGRDQGRGRGRLRPIGASGEVDRFGQRADRIDPNAGDERRLGGVFRRHDRRAQAAGARGEHHRKDARDRPHRAVERELADEEQVGQRRRGERAVGREQAHRGGQVVRRAHLAQAGGRHAHGDSTVPFEGVAAVAQRRADATLALLDRGVGEAQHRELGEAGRGVGFDADEMGFDPHHRRGQGCGEHDSPFRRQEGESLRPARLA